MTIYEYCDRNLNLVKVMTQGYADKEELIERCKKRFRKIPHSVVVEFWAMQNIRSGESFCKSFCKASLSNPDKEPVTVGYFLNPGKL